VADDLLRLQLAFTLHMADQILGSDAHIDDAERSWLHERFPAEMLRETGFVDADGNLTSAYEEAQAIAHAALLLGVSDDDWSQHLAELEAAGTLKRDGCAEKLGNWLQQTLPPLPRRR